MKKVLALILSILLIVGCNLSVLLMTANATDTGGDVDIDMFDPDPSDPGADPYGWASISDKTKTFGTTTEVTGPTGQTVYKLTLSGLVAGDTSKAQAYTTNKNTLKKNTTYELSAWVYSDLPYTRMSLYVPTASHPEYAEATNDYGYYGNWTTPAIQIGAYQLKFESLKNNVSAGLTTFSTFRLETATTAVPGNTNGWTKMTIKFTTDDTDVCVKDTSVAFRMEKANGTLYFSDVSLIQYAPVVTPANVSLESGTDAGYVTNDGNSYTAVPYDGNEFLGWYNASGLISSALTCTLSGSDGAVTAKFKNNSIFASPGFEQSVLGTVSDHGDNTKDWHCAASWSSVSIAAGTAHTGKNALKFFTHYQGDVYTNISGLQTNTYYTVSFYWMMPVGHTTDNGNSYRGMVVSKPTDSNGAQITKTATATANSLGQAYNANGEDPVAGVWKKVNFEFNTGDLTSVKLFMEYLSLPAYGTSLYLDEFSIYKTPAGVHSPEFKTLVSAENGTAYVANSNYVPTGSTVSVTADANKGYQFDGWYENNVKVCSTVDYTYQISANRNLVAKFVPTAASAYDVDNDGYINDNDAVAVRSHILGKTLLTGIALTKADVNKDGKVSVSDIVLLRKNFDGSTPQNLTGAALKTAVMSGTYQKMLDDSIDNQGNMVRIANAMRKAQSGQPVTVAFIGGSITEGARASTPANRYANLVKDWWVKTFPQSTITFYNMGIGSTTSLLGVNRLAEDVLSKNPDFVVVDFTTNDSSGDPQYRSPYENLIRRLLEYKTQPGVLSIYFGPVDSTLYNSGVYQRAGNSESSHKPSGLFYDIPIINYYNTIWEYLNAGVMTWPEIAGDYIHPSDAGHKMASSCINNYLSKVFANLSTIGTVAPPLPSEFFWGSADYMNATLMDNDNLKPTTITNFNVVNYTSGCDTWSSWQSTAASGELVFTLNNCKTFSIMRQYLTAGGSAEVYINGQKYTSFSCVGTDKLNWLAFTYTGTAAENLVVDIKTTGTVTITSLLYSDGTHPLSAYDSQTTSLKALDANVKLDGRTSWNGNDLQLDWMGSGFELVGNLSGQVKLNLNYTGTKMNTYVVIDNDYANATQNILASGSSQYVIANVTPGKHKIQFFKATEASMGVINVTGITYSGQLYQKPNNKSLKIEFVGDSITSAASLSATETDTYLNQDGFKSYATLTAKAMNADYSCISKSGIAVTVGAKTIFDYYENTNYRDSTKWDFASNQVDIVVINLGTNDTPTYLTTNQDVLKQGVKNLLTLARSKYPNAKIVWTYGMMDTRIPTVYQTAVTEMNDSKMYFKMINRNDPTGQYGHPTVAGQQADAAELTTFLKSIVG